MRARAAASLPITMLRAVEATTRCATPPQATHSSKVAHAEAGGLPQLVSCHQLLRLLLAHCQLQGSKEERMEAPWGCEHVNTGDVLQKHCCTKAGT